MVGCHQWLLQIGRRLRGKGIKERKDVATELVAKSRATKTGQLDQDDILSEYDYWNITNVLNWVPIAPANKTEICSSIASIQIKLSCLNSDMGRSRIYMYRSTPFPMTKESITFRQSGLKFAERSCHSNPYIKHKV